MKKNKITEAFSQWESKNTNDYIKAVCKPCWELNYCPYGPLVEEFPFVDDVEYSCSVFGHICPVFKVAEPLSETLMIRGTSRHISHSVKLQVSRRDQNICQICRCNIPDDEMNYDHIIPYSKGGSSQVNNIRILCQTCNNVRRNDFESEFLNVASTDLLVNPQKISTEKLEDLLSLQKVYLIIKSIVDSEDEIRKKFLQVIKTDDLNTDLFMYKHIKNINSFLNDENNIGKTNLSVLKFRWGIASNCISSIEESARKFKLTKDYCLQAEKVLIRQLGFVLDIKSHSKDEYFKQVVDNFSIEEEVKQRLQTIFPDLEVIQKFDYNRGD